MVLNLSLVDKCKTKYYTMNSNKSLVSLEKVSFFLIMIIIGESRLFKLVYHAFWLLEDFF